MQEMVIICSNKFANLKITRTFALPFEKRVTEKVKEFLKKTGAEMKIEKFLKKSLEV